MNRHPEGPLNERAQSGSRLRAALARKWAERASRTEGPCVFYYIECMSLKHKVPQGYSPADLPIHAKSGREWGPDNAGSFTPFEMTLCKNGLNRRKKPLSKQEFA